MCEEIKLSTIKSIGDDDEQFWCVFCIKCDLINNYLRLEIDQNLIFTYIFVNYVVELAFVVLKTKPVLKCVCMQGQPLHLRTF